jgi:Phage tail protein
MDAIITKLNGETKKLFDLGIKVTDFNVSSISKRLYSESIEGRPGAIDLGFDFEKRKIKLDVIITAADSLDFPLLRDEIFYWLGDGEPFYIQEGREPNGVSFAIGTNPNEYYYGKRYLVTTADAFSFEQTFVYGSGTIELQTVGLPFAESSLTTATPMTTDSDGWQFGQGLLLDDDANKYKHDTKTFRIYNAGNVAVNPRFMPLKITLSNMTGGGLRLRNLTNGTSVLINVAVATGDTITIDGLRILKNSLSILRNTDKGLITISPGWNDFQIDYLTNTTPHSEFEFRYYYL